MKSCDNHSKCIKSALSEAEKICDKNNLRFTDLRQKVFLIILQSHQSCKAYDILETLQKNDSSAKPATVYRSLDFLLDYGLVHKLHSLNSYVICSHPLRHSRCSFLICYKCNEVLECCDDDISKEIEKIGSNNSFLVKQAAIEIGGICSSCNHTKKTSKDI